MAPCTGPEFSHPSVVKPQREVAENVILAFCATAHSTVMTWMVKDDGMNGWMASSGVGEVDESLV